MKPLLRKLKRLADRFLGTKADEWYWRYYHIIKNKTWAEEYLSPASLAHPHRKSLVEAIESQVPFESLLEIGCASGPNLFNLAEKFPHIKLYGVDISRHAIEVGKKFFEEKKDGAIRNVELARVKSGSDLKLFADKSLDIIITDAALIYIGEDKINELAKEMLRVAKKALILVELHTEETKAFRNDHWIRNYRQLFQNSSKDIKLSMEKIPENIWDGDWARYGYIITVSL